MANHRVGGEVDAFCTRCKMTLAHTILAMVGTSIARVQCNTCSGQHAFRSPPGTSSSRARSSSSSGASAATKAASRESLVKTVSSFEEQLRGKDLSRAKKYSPRETFAVDEVMDHPTFGLGIVRAVRHDKVEVAFKSQERTLIHGRSEAGGAKPAFSPPTGRMAGVADKPQAADPGAAPGAGTESAEPQP
jgi:hypothetical protein